jgi:hypothetical protein
VFVIFPTGPVVERDEKDCQRDGCEGPQIAEPLEKREKVHGENLYHKLERNQQREQRIF